jgi:hypothetical protein
MIISVASDKGVIGEKIRNYYYMSKKFHEHCFVCGKHSKKGLKLKFVFHDNNSLSGNFKISDEYQGYDKILHGGIISAILDSSMVHLYYMLNGTQLKTAKLNIRFKKSIPTETTFTVIAIADETARHFYKAKSQIKIGDIVFAEAEGYFRKSE